MVDTPRPNTDQIIAESLRDTTTQDTFAVAEERGNDLANSELATDLREMSQLQLRMKYGDDVANNRHRLMDGRDRLYESDNSDRTFGEAVMDAAVSASTALYRDIGTLGILAYSYGKGALDGDPDTNGSAEAAEMLAAHSQMIAGMQQQNLTQELQDRQYFEQIEGELDRADSQAQYDREVEAGADPFMSSLRQQGRDAMNALGRNASDPMLVSNIIADGVGSLVGSAPLAGVGGVVAKGATYAVTRNVLAQRVAAAVGTSAGAGVSEVSGVYSETVNDVMSVPTEMLMETSPVMQALVAEGYTPDEARIQLAGITAETAALRQIAPTLALGFITSRFERLPIGVFQESGVARGLLQIAGEGLEEAGQGATGTYNRNVSVEQYAQIGRNALEGVGEQAALGALAGMGMAGVAATPAAAGGAARVTVDGVARGAQATADALFNEVTYNDPLRQEMYGRDSRAEQATQAVVNVADRVVDAGSRAASAVVSSPAVAYAVDIIARGEAKETKQTTQDVLDLNDTINEKLSQEDVTLEIQEAMAPPAPETVSESFQGLEGSNVVETVAGITAKLSERGFRPTDDDTVYAAGQLQRLSTMVDSVGPKAKRQIGKILSSNVAKKIMDNAAKIDLNKTTPTGEVTPQEVNTTVNVAKTNPANVNPDRTDQILEQSGENISEQDLKITRVASKTSRAINDNVDTQIEIRRGENVSLTQLQEKPKAEKSIQNTSRSILAAGYESKTGKKLRSINDFAADIIKGIQSPDGKVLNEQGRSIPVKQVAKELVNFVQHMNNRVDALNRSFDSNRVNPKTGRLTGQSLGFRGLVDADRWVEEADWKGSKVAYHRGSPGSVANAQQVELDTRTAETVLNAIKEEFPEIFEGLPEVQSVVLRTEADAQTIQETEQNPTVLDEETAAAVSEEQNQEVEAQEAASQIIDEVSSSEQGDTESVAPADDEVTTSEEVRTEEPAFDDSDLNEENLLQKLQSLFVKENLNKRRINTRRVLKEIMGEGVAKAVRDIQVYKADGTIGPGYVWYDSERRIYLREDMFDENHELTEMGRAVAVHEAGHLVDYLGDPDVGTWISKGRDFYEGGKIFAEFMGLKGYSPWLDDRITMVEFYEGHDMAKEMFAVLSELYHSIYPDVFNNTPAISQLMERTYGQRTQATGTGSDTTEGSEVVEQSEPQPSEVGGTDTSTTTEGRQVSPEFGENFTEKNTKDHPKTLAEFVEVATRKGMNPETLKFVQALAPILQEALSKRLQIKVKDGGKTQTVLKHIQEGRTQFRDFKAGLLVDPVSGMFDKNMVDLAAVVMGDWLMTNTGSNPNQLEDTLEKLGVSIHEITDEDFNAILNGVPPSFAADAVANDLLRMWDVRENAEAATDDLHGIAQGFAKELFSALSDSTDLVTVQDVTLIRDGETQKTQTILVNNQSLKDVRNDVQANQGEGVKLTAKEAIFGDLGQTYSIGSKLPSVAVRQDRTDVRLSDLERRALQKMQDTPTTLDTVVQTVLGAFDEGGLQNLLGYREDVDSIKNPVLRRSVQGKNASILSNIDETVALVSAIPDENTPVYFPVGVTKVGRHQYKGPNPQSNKLMRAIVTPTWSTVSLTNLDNFWIAVGQASDIGGINKAEKLAHADIIANASTKFYEKYGQAVPMIKAALKDGAQIDSAAMIAVTGVIEPQQLKAIIAVAQMELAVETGQSTFRTSLSFELDGLTNGVANMMVNFGQGDLSDSDYLNFQRVGFFPGKVGETVNNFFAKVGALDMYETVSRLGDKMMWEGHNRLEQWQKDQRIASGRLAAAIGNFEIGEDGKFKMTRNTSKNPMTKVNYGSGVRGVAVGVADDMLLKFYEDMQVKPAGVKLDDFYYPGFRKDMETMGLSVSDNVSPAFVFDQETVKKFQTKIQYSIGEVLTEATKSTIGDKITELNDLLVFSTNVQSQYLQNIYDKRLEELGEKLAKEGVIGRNSKTQKPNLGQIPKKYFRELETELMQLAPIFVSDDQTLAIGGFKKKLSNLVTSTNFEGRLNQKAVMPLPDDVGVRAIPFTVIGSGDAMMMNLIFGSEGAPNDVLGIFDGLDIPLDKIQEYAPYVNQQVLKSWERDVLGMAVANFQGFLNADLDQDALNDAFKTVVGKNKKSTVSVSSLDQLMDQLTERHRQNKARKKVFKELAVSVDQMGGSNVGFTREGIEANVIEINARIQRELEGKPQDLKENVKEPVQETTLSAVLKTMRLSADQKKVLDVIGSTLPDDTRVVFGTVDQIRDWRAQNVPDDTNVLLDVKGAYDLNNNIIYLTTMKPETILHEMVHAATFTKVLNHYEGNTNDAVIRLEALMEEFLKMEGGQNVRDAQAAILRNLNVNKPEKKAAAVNEFMAYALTNPQTRSKLKSTETSTLKGLADKVIQLMRRLMGGIPKDMFSQVVFNTKVLIDPPLDDNFDQGNGGNGDGGSTGNGDLTPPAGNYTNYWTQTLAEYIDSLDTSTTQGARRTRNTARDLLNADKVMGDLRQAGMLRNPEDRQTFRAIYGIIKSEIIMDPNSLIALSRVFQHVEENMDPSMFGTGTEANNIYSAIINSFGGFKNGDTTDAVAVLFALSQTSAKFRAVLDQIEGPETQAPGTGLNAFLARGTNLFMKKLMGSIADGAPKEVLDGLKQTIIDSDREKEYAVLNRVTKTLDAADKAVSGLFSRTAEGMRKTDERLKNEAANTTKQYLVSAVTSVTNLLDRPGSDLTAQNVQRVAHMGLPFLKIVPIRELVDEFVGTNRDNAAFVRMLDVVNSKVSGVRQAYREKLPGILKNEFSEEPHPEQWKSMYRTLAKTDFTSFVDLNNMQRSMQLLEETGVRQARIQQLETQLGQQVNPTIQQEIKDKAMQLARFMNGHGAGKLLARNAYAIVAVSDASQSDTLVSTVDELVSLYAINDMDADIREMTVQLWQNEPKAIMSIVSFIQGLNEVENQKVISEAAKLNAYKGYIPNLGRDNHRIVVALDSAENEMLHRGYRKIAPFSGDVGSAFPTSYYVTNISQQGMYSQGIMQNVANTYRGVDVNTGLTVTGDTAGYISSDMLPVEDIMDDLLDPNYVLEDDSETLLPVLGDDGSIMGFERTVNPVLSDTLLGREENLAVNLGAWAGRQVEEGLATQYNRALIDKLDDLYQNRERGSDHQFVNLKTTKDKIYAESYKLIPQDIKVYAESKFDGTGLMVPESMVNLSVGYREASIADLWTGKTRMPDGLVKAVRAVTKIQLGEKSLRTLLVQSEAIGQSVVSDAKDIIVVKSLIVPMANTQANMVQLATNGIPTKQIVKQYRSKLAEIVEYNKNVGKLIDLNHQRNLTNDPRRRQHIDAKIQVLEDLNAKMTIAPMIEAGAYKQLSEGITDLDVAATNGGLADWLEKKANELPETMGNIAKVGLVSKSTELYKAANRATQYGDFLAKSIMYDHLISQGLSADKALDQMNEEFVNFSVNPGRMRSMLERNGASWFMAFKIRIAKIAAKQMRENPVRALAINSMFDFGSPIEDNIFTVIGDGRIDYATGWEMLFSAPELQPWVNLMNGN